MGEPITTGLLIGGGLSALGAVGGSAIAANGADSVNKDTMQYNHDEAMINRAWQEQMYGRQLADQQAMYKQQLKDQRETYEKYQSPAALGQSLARLGVNPASVFGKVSGGSMPSAVSAPAVPSIASGSSASVSGLLNPSASYAQGLQGVTGQAAQMLSVISDSKLKDAQTLHVLKQAYGQEFTNQMLEISASIAKWQIPEKAKAEINDLMASAALKNANGKLADAQTDVEKIMKTIRENDVKLGSQQILELSIRLAHLDTLLNNQEKLGFEQIKTEKSLQSRNYSEGRLASENAKTVHAIRADVVRYHKSIANIKDTEDFVSSNTAWNNVQQSLYELQAAKLVPEQISKAIERAKKANDWYEVNMLLGIVDEGVKAYGTYYGAKTGKGFVDAQNVRNDIDAKYKDYLQNKQPKHKVYNIDSGDVYWSD